MAAEIAVVRYSLSEIASEINRQHEAGEKAISKGLECWRHTGELLIEAKRQVPYGQWAKWIEKNCKFGRMQAAMYISLAQALLANPSLQLAQCTSLQKALKILSDANKPTTEETEAEDIQDAEYSTPLEIVDDTTEDTIPHVARATGQEEWYTPPEYLEAAREVLGGIDLDPASSEIAQANVQATRYHTVQDDGLAQHWKGTVWLNPPYTAGLVDKFSEKLLCHYKSGDVSAAIVLVNNATETGWFQSLARVSTAICFPAKRIKFLRPNSDDCGSPLQGQAVLYLGTETHAFCERFKAFGLVVGVR